VELNDLYFPPNIFRVITLRIMRWSGHVTNMGEGKFSIGLWWLKLKEGEHTAGTGLDGRIIIRWAIKKWDVGA
jgi:hypothetical protein